MDTIFDQYPYSLYIKHMAQKIRELTDQLLLKYGLNTSQAILLKHINDAVEEEIEVNRKFLQRTMSLSGPSVTNLLNGLEKGGFIIRKSNPADGRNLNIEVTEKGKQLMNETSTAFAKSETMLTEGMSDAERAMFVSLLTRAANNIDKHLSK